MSLLLTKATTAQHHPADHVVPAGTVVDLSFFVGPAAAATSEVDIAFIIGLLVSGLVYIAVTRSLDVTHELALIDAGLSLTEDKKKR